MKSQHEKMFLCLKEIKTFVSKTMLYENLILKKKENKIYVVSDDPNEKQKPFKDWETVRNKEKLKKAGFSFDGTAWWLPTTKLQQAQEIISQINNSPIEQFIDKVEDLPDFIDSSDDFSKKGDLTRKIEGFIDALSKEVDEVKATKIYKEYIEFASKFHTYSFNNIILIYIQNPNATKLMGYKKWNTVNRRVKKGAKAIWIYAPMIMKDDDFESGSDAGFDSAVQNKKVVGFKAVKVFDITDTESMNPKGEIPQEPKWFGDSLPEEKADRLFDLGLKLSDNLGIKVDREEAKRGEKGWALKDHINIVTDIAGAGAFSTLIHEIAHSLMHFEDSSPFFINDENKLSKEEKELQAETVSYIVLKHYDLPAQHHPVYLAIWKANKESFQKHMSIMTKVASFVIKNIDKLQASSENNLSEKVVKITPNKLTEMIKEEVKKFLNS